MHWSISSNWCDEVIDKAVSLGADELMGAALQPMGHAEAMGGFPKELSLNDRERHIRAAVARGLSFNYIVDAPCLGNREFAPRTDAAILEHLKWAADLGVSAFTVSSTFLVERIKRRYPHIKVVASRYSFVDSVERARHFQTLGADAITVHPDANRDLPLLSAIKKEFDGELCLVVNHGCAFHCVHAQFHAMESGHRTQGAFDDCRESNPIECTFPFEDKLDEIVKVRWIRPEDISMYADLIEPRFVILGQLRSSAWIEEAAGAWRSGLSRGDLLRFLDGGFRSRNLHYLNMQTNELFEFSAGFEGRGCRNHCAACTHCSTLAASFVKDERSVPCSIRS